MKMLLETVLGEKMDMLFLWHRLAWSQAVDNSVTLK